MFRFRSLAVEILARRRVAIAVIFAAAMGIGGGSVRSQCVCCCGESFDSAEVPESDDIAAERLTAWPVTEDDEPVGGILGGFGDGAFAGADRDRLFPLGGEMLRDRGYAIPLPIGVGATVLYTDQLFDVNQVQVGVGGLPPLPVEVVDIPSLFNRNTTTSVRYDFWVLPFLNVYGITGYTTGITTGEVVVGQVAGLPGLVTIPVRTQFEGPTYGGGFTAAIGYRKLFASVDWHYTETNLNMADSAVSNEVFTPRIGLNGPRGSLWVGASHQKIDQRLTVTNQLLGLVPIDTVTDYRTARPWNFCYGFRFFFCEHLELFVEHGFSGRNQVMGHLTVRF